MTTIYVPSGRAAYLLRANIWFSSVNALYTDLSDESMIVFCVNKNDHKVLLINIDPFTELANVQVRVNELGLCRVLIAFKKVDSERLKALEDLLRNMRHKNIISSTQLQAENTGLSINMSDDLGCGEIPGLFFYKNNQRPELLLCHPQQLEFYQLYTLERLLIRLTVDLPRYQVRHQLLIFNGYAWLEIPCEVLDLVAFCRGQYALSPIIEGFYLTNAFAYNIAEDLRQVVGALLKKQPDILDHEATQIYSDIIQIIAPYLEQRIHGSELNYLFRQNVMMMIKPYLSYRIGQESQDPFAAYHLLIAKQIQELENTEEDGQVFIAKVLECLGKQPSKTPLLKILSCASEQYTQRKQALDRTETAETTLTIYKKLISVISDHYRRHEYAAGLNNAGQAIRTLMQYGFVNDPALGKAYYWLGVNALMLNKNKIAYEAAQACVAILRECSSVGYSERSKAECLLAEATGRCSRTSVYTLSR